MRDDNPSIVLVPGIGMFSFGKSKPESRITGEFYTNAIHVMEGASAMGEGELPRNFLRPGQQHRLRHLRCARIMWLCRRWRLSGSNTGRWKRPRFAASRRRSSLAAR